MRDDGSLPLLRLPKRKDDIAQLRRVLKNFRTAPRQKFRDVIILGTGGSSLGGQTLYALADERAQPRLHFLDNIDPATFAALFAAHRSDAHRRGRDLEIGRHRRDDVAIRDLHRLAARQARSRRDRPPHHRDHRAARQSAAAASRRD